MSCEMLRPARVPFPFGVGVVVGGVVVVAGDWPAGVCAPRWGPSELRRCFVTALPPAASG